MNVDRRQAVGQAPTVDACRRPIDRPSLEPLTDASLTASTLGDDVVTWRRLTIGLALMTCLVGTVYAFVTPAGLPYDEPSHWATVQYYADHGRMPVLGDKGVTYEAQMGPVAYVADAVIVRIADTLGFGAETAFRLVRLFGVLQLAALVVVPERSSPA